MKIVGFKELTGYANALELDQFPTSIERATFDEWLLENEWALPYAHLGNFYEAAFIGDINYPAIMISNDCPQKTLTMIIMKWS